LAEKSCASQTDFLIDLKQIKRGEHNKVHIMSDVLADEETFSYIVYI